MFSPDNAVNGLGWSVAYRTASVRLLWRLWLTLVTFGHSLNLHRPLSHFALWHSLWNSRHFPPTLHSTSTQDVIIHVISNSMINLHDTTKNWHSPKCYVKTEQFSPDIIFVSLKFSVFWSLPTISQTTIKFPHISWSSTLVISLHSQAVAVFVQGVFKKFVDWHS